jgi:hypothetical protein
MENLYSRHTSGSSEPGKVQNQVPGENWKEEMKSMKQLMLPWLFWTPRILCIGFAVFISLFALDVFQQGAGFWRTLAALGIHLIPTGILLLILALAWRWEWVGGIFLIGTGGWYISNNLKHPDWCLLIAGPAILIGMLFLLNWRYRNQLRAKS